ncbi:hypothetical protein Tco_0616498 [Tanacetum coccineum]
MGRGKGMGLAVSVLGRWFGSETVGKGGGMTDAKPGSVDGGFVALVVGGRMDVDCCGGGMKDGNDYGMTVENTSEE